MIHEQRKYMKQQRYVVLDTTNNRYITNIINMMVNKEQPQYTDDITLASVLDSTKTPFNTETTKVIPIELFETNGYDDTPDFKCFSGQETPTQVINILSEIVNREFRLDGSMQSHKSKGTITVTVEGLEQEFCLSGYELFYWNCGCVSGIDLKVSKI